MARKRYSDGGCLRLLREIESHLSGGKEVATACWTAGISDATYYSWCKRFGSMSRSDLAEKRALKKRTKASRKSWLNSSWINRSLKRRSIF